MTSDDAPAGRSAREPAGPTAEEPTDAVRVEPSALLLAMRLSDSFLPLGTHTASYGLEQYLNDGEVETVAELRELVGAYLHRVVGPCEVVALGAAHDGAGHGDPDRILAADRRLHATTLPSEFRESSTTAGERLLDLLAETGELPPATAALAEAVAAGETPGNFPVVLGCYAAEAGLPRDATALVHGYAFVSELLGAAQRLGRFGHTAIQATLVELLEEVQALPSYAGRDLEAMASFAPLAEVAGARHERADRRLFVS